MYTDIYAKPVNFIADKTCLQPGTKMVLVHIANITHYDNCEGCEFFYNKSVSLLLCYIKPT